MSRLPTPGSDDGNWGDILNDYLEQAHKDDGTLKDDILTDAAIAPANIDGDTGTPSLRTLGDGAQQAYPGSAGAANAATIAALEESANDGLITQIVLLNSGAPGTTSGSSSAYNISPDQYVSFLPSWFTNNSSTSFSLTDPGLYSVSILTSSNPGMASGSSIKWSFLGDQANDMVQAAGASIAGVSGQFSSLCLLLAVYDNNHPDPALPYTLGYSHLVGTYQTNSHISVTAQPFFTGGGTGPFMYSKVSITRLQAPELAI